MEYIIELLADHQFDDIAVTVCYLADAIRAYFGDGSDWGVKIQYQEEPSPLGTAGGVKFMATQLDDTFIVMSGDGLTDFNLTDALQVHRQTGAIATLLLTKVQCPLGYGVVDLSTDGRVQRFIEKPKTWLEGESYYINTGIYILEPTIVDYIPANRPFDFGHELFPLLLQLGLPVFGYEPDGYWSDVGTLHQYYQSQIDMIIGRVRVNLPPEVALVR